MMNSGTEKLIEIFVREGVINYVQERRIELMTENRNIEEFNLVFSSKFSNGITKELAEKEQVYVDINNSNLFGMDIVLSNSIMQPFKIIPKVQKC